MSSIKYLDASMYGLHFVNCQVLRKIDDNTFEIEFYDYVEEEYETKIVDRSRLKFPELHEYAI